MQTKTNRVQTFIIAFYIASLVFFVWETQLTINAMSEPAWQRPLFLITFVILGVLSLFSKGMSILSFPIILHEIGSLLGGLLSGYSFSGFMIGRYRITTVAGRLIAKKYPASINIQCLMNPPEKGPDKCPYRLYLLGGSLLLLVFTFAGFFLYYWFQRNVFAFLFGFFPAYLSIYVGLAVIIPYKANGNATNTYLAFIAFPKHPSVRSAHYYTNRIFSILFDIDNLEAFPSQIIEVVMNHDYSLLEYHHVALLLDLKTRFHVYRNELEEEKLCYDTIYNSPVMNSTVRSIAQMYFLFNELTNECRRQEVEKYYDKTLKDYFKKVPKSPTTRRMMYAYRLLYENNASLAQKELEKFEKIIASYPDKIDVTNEWDAIHEIQRSKLMKDRGQSD